jgi:hypothetical protein
MVISDDYTKKRRLESQSNIAQNPKASKPPMTFQLATNYRSHAGIVNCAHAVIELITTFWPDAIDSLAPEKGIVEGLKPVFLHGWDNDSVRYVSRIFFAWVYTYQAYRSNSCLVRGAISAFHSDLGLTGYHTTSGDNIEFGAQQCKPAQQLALPPKITPSIGILVRDDFARQKLRNQVGDIGMIM